MRIAYLAVASALILLLLRMNLQLHLEQGFSRILPEKDVLLQLEYLSGRLRSGAAAIASLAIYDRKFPPRYDGFIGKWLEETDRRLDDFTGLIPHSADAGDGKPGEGARGSSQSLILRLFAKIDSTRSRRHYQGFRSTFMTKFMMSFIGLPGIREYPNGKEGPGSIDSGPVLFDIGAAATIVGIGAARANGDAELSRSMSGFVEAIGFPVRTQSRKWYGFGLLPVGEAFLCWAKATLPGQPQSFDAGNGRNGVCFLHFVSALIMGLLLLPLAFWFRVRRLR